MGKKLKKLLCGVLSAAMLISSFGMVSLAEGETTAAYDYESDSYYNKALTLCKALGIITGYEDGNVQPEKVVTRAEMATIVLRALNNTATSSYADGLFSDITSEHWAAATIQTAYDEEIIDGFPDGTFKPNDDVTGVQVQKMLVYAANYDGYADDKGGYPTGVLKAAEDKMKLNKGVTLSDYNVGLERGNVIKMVYNALVANYRNKDTNDETRTWLDVKFGISQSTGILQATSATSINSSVNPRDGQIAIDGVVYYYDGESLDKNVGMNVIYYYKEGDRGLTVVAAIPDAAVTSTETIDVTDVKELSGFDSTSAYIRMDASSKTYRMSETVQVIYNGAEITEADYNAITDTSRLLLGSTYDEFLLPKMGEIRLVDNDSDSKYDIMYVDSYQTARIVTATDKKVTALTAEYNSSGSVTATETMVIDVDTSSSGKVVNVTRNGSEVASRSLRVDDVATIKRSLDDSVVEIIVTGESLKGAVTATSKGVNNVTVATIDGTKYEVAPIAVSGIKLTEEAVFYFDSFGRIAFIDSQSQGGLSLSEKYGWIMLVIPSESGGNASLRLYTQGGKSQDLVLANQVNYWGPRDTEASSKTALEVSAAITSAISATSSSAGFVKLDNASGATQIRLVKYSTNSSDQITKLYCAVEKSFADSNSVSEDALVVDAANMRDMSSSGSVVNGYFLKSGINLMVAPISTSDSDIRSASNYSFGLATVTDYLGGAEGVAKDFIVGQFKDGSYPQIIIEFGASKNEKVNINTINTSSSPNMMVVTSIATGVDSNGNTLYEIMGYSEGEAVSVETKVNSAVYKLIGFSGKNLDGAQLLWDATASSVPDLSTVLKQGDVIAYTDGGAIVKVADVDEVKAYAASGATPSNGIVKDNKYYYDYNRVSYAFGDILKNETGSTGVLSIGVGSSEITAECDVSKTFDLVTIRQDGTVMYDTDGTTIAELAVYDAVNQYGDLGLVQAASGSTLDNVVIYRFLED